MVPRREGPPPPDGHSRRSPPATRSGRSRSFATEQLERWCHVPRARHWRGELGEPVTHAVLDAGHAFEHALQTRAIRAERQEHEAVLAHAAESGRPAEHLE